MNQQLIARLDYWVVSYRGNRLIAHGSTEWSDEVFPDLDQLADDDSASPLSNFLHDARQLWNDRTDEKLSSEIWWESWRGTTLPFRAEAVHLDGEALLLIQRLGLDFDKQHAILQRAREQTLTAEYLESEVARRTEQIREREIELASRLISAACARDEETGAHIRRIGLYSEAMARICGWPMADRQDIRAAAPMHDIGKIAIPDHILRKPGPLTAAERKIMMTHPALGAQILQHSDIPMLRMAADIAHCHHERFDGSGYPDGLAGEAIPLAARVVAIADVYDALVHARVYKPAIPEYEAIQIMRSMSGHFDPGLLTIFIAHLDEMRAIRFANPDEDEAAAVDRTYAIVAARR